MKVRELIELLKNFEGDKEVYAFQERYNRYAWRVEIATTKKLAHYGKYYAGTLYNEKADDMQEVVVLGYQPEVKSLEKQEK